MKPEITSKEAQDLKAYIEANPNVDVVYWRRSPPYGVMGASYHEDYIDTVRAYVTHTGSFWRITQYDFVFANTGATVRVPNPTPEEREAAKRRP